MNDSLGQTQEKQAYVNTEAIEFINACQKMILGEFGFYCYWKSLDRVYIILAQ